MLRRLVVIALLVLGVSACGGSDSPPTLAEYEEAVVTTRDRVDFALARITRAGSQDEFFNRMDEAAVAIDEAASDLEDTGAPELFVDENERFTSALHQLSVDLSATAHDLRQPELGNVITGGGFQGLNFDSWDKANRALAAMIGDGIDVALIGRH